MINKLLSANLAVSVLFPFTVSVTVSQLHRPTETILRPVRRQFFVLDPDCFGFISIGEANERYRAQFDNLDLDPDGALSVENIFGLRICRNKYHQSERWTEIQAVREANFVKFNKNADRFVSFAEYTDFQLCVFLQSMEYEWRPHVEYSC